MNYIKIYHANLNYAFLIPENYERVIRASYEVILDCYKKYPEAKFVFEASGYTIDMIAELCPDVLGKLKEAIAEGRCEFMGAPYSHPIMANVPEEDGYWSCEFAQRSYEKHLGQRAESFWNPECTWMQYVPRAFQRAGVKYLTLDFESYMNCSDKDYAWVERNRTKDIGWGGHLPWFELDPDCKFLHRPFRNVVPGLYGFCRSDRLVGKMLKYLRGGEPLESVIDNIKYWSGTKGEGATCVMADDAEYCGTAGYYYVKYQGDYSRCFEIDPDAPARLDSFLRELLKLGGTMTFKEACEEIEPVEEPFFVEDRFAWHRTWADAWKGTPEAMAWEPIMNDMRNEYKTQYQPIVEDPAHAAEYKELVDEFWLHMTNSANSDGRWPPPPLVTCAFNRDWVLKEIEATKQVLAKLKDVCAGKPLPPPAETAAPDKNSPHYGFHFTDKNPEDIKNLNNYELQHAIYYAHKMVDCPEKEWHEKGIVLLNQVFNELDRRGMKGVRPPSIRK